MSERSERDSRSVERRGTWVGGHEWEALGARERGTRTESATDWKPRGEILHTRTYTLTQTLRVRVPRDEQESERPRDEERRGTDGKRKREIQNAGYRSSDDEVVTVRWRRRRRRRNEVEQGTEERISGDSTHGESRGGTGQPDRAASLVGCTEGRQLPAGLPPPRIIRDERERDRARSGKRHLEKGDKGGQRARERAREKSRAASLRGEGPERARHRPVRLAVKSARLKRGPLRET